MANNLLLLRTEIKMIGSIVAIALIVAAITISINFMSMMMMSSSSSSSSSSMNLPHAKLGNRRMLSRADDISDLDLRHGRRINVDGESTQSPHDALTTNNNNSNDEGLFDTSFAADYNIENRATRAEDRSFVIDDDDVFLDDTIIEVTYTSTPPPTKRPTRRPTRSPTRRPTTTTSNPACVTLSTYDAIDADIANLKNNIADAKSRSHFLGGIVRLAAHDFMDYDRNTPSNPMGPDGCFDVSHASNNGLSSIWCSTCPLTLLHKQKYSQISKADFWIAAANAVIRQTSVNNALNLRSTFRWGRKDASSCSGSGTRLPTPTGCTSVQNTFLTRMGLSWRDAAVLMGGHTLGRGDSSFSGHHGIWEDTDTDAQRFDKQYFEEIYLNSWRPRNPGTSLQDWTTGRPGSTTTRMMLNTDLCLVYDIPGNNLPCCTRTGVLYPNGDDTCIEAEAAARKCPVLSASHSRYEARQTVGEMLGGSFPNSNNVPFYTAFTESWNKATTLGQSNLSLLKSTC